MILLMKASQWTRRPSRSKVNLGPQKQNVLSAFSDWLAKMWVYLSLFKGGIWMACVLLCNCENRGIENANKHASLSSLHAEQKSISVRNEAEKEARMSRSQRETMESFLRLHCFLLIHHGVFLRKQTNQQRIRRFAALFCTAVSSFSWRAMLSTFQSCTTTGKKT